MNKKKKYSCITIESIYESNTEKTTDVIYDGEFIIISIIRFENRCKKFVEYVRTRKSPLDVLANIGALFSTFLIYLHFFSNCIQEIIIIIK